MLPASIRLPWQHSRRAFWLLLLVALIVLSAGMGLRDPWPSDEPRFNLLARQMWESGQYLITYRGVEMYSDKPPMFMWLQVASYALTGSWRIAFLLPSLLAALGTLALLHDLARRLWSARAAWWSSAMLLATLHFAFQAKRAQIDATLLFLVTLSLYGVLRHLLAGPAWRWYAIGWFAAGIGTITKGVGVLALLVLLPYAVARWRGWSGLAVIPWRDWRWLLGPPCFLLALSLWLVPMLLATYGSGDPELIGYADDLLFNQTANRYADSWDHHAPFYYYAGVMLSMWLPGSLLLPWLLPAWRRRWARRDARILLPLIWAGMLVIFFSFSPGKRDVYILPALPMLLLAAAPLLAGLWRRPGAQRLAGLTALALSAVLLGIGATALLGNPGYEQSQIEKLGGSADGLWWMALSCGVTGLLACAWAGLRRGLLGYFAVMALLWAVVLGWWGPVLLNDTSSARGVMQRARDLVGPEVDLGLVAWQEQNLLQALPPVTNFGFQRIGWEQQWQLAVAWLNEAPAQRRIFVRESMLDDCIDREQILYAGVGNRRGWYIIPQQALIAGCVRQPSTLRDADRE